MATSMLTNNNNNNNDEVFSEIEERRHAELEIILSAYEGDDNIWIIPSLKSLDEKNNKEEKYPLASSSPEIHRRFTLENSTPNSNNNNDTKQIIELIVTMPQENQYPVLDTSVLHVDGKVIQQEDTKNDILELMLKKHLPHFIDACRQVANENHGMESIFMVLAKADEWIEHEWTTIQQQEQQQEENETNLKKKLSLSFSKINDTTNTSATTTTTTTTKTKPPPQPSRYQSQSQPQQFYLHVIRSHHLLNHAPDNLLAKGGTKYKLNGFYRFGTPGLAFCITTNNNNNDNDHVNVENFKRAMETKMSQKKFEIILARPMSTMTTRTNNELYHGWNEATIEQLQSILTHDEFRDILNIQGGGGGSSSSSNRTANTTTTTTGNTKNKGTKKNGKNKGNKKK